MGNTEQLSEVDRLRRELQEERQKCATLLRQLEENDDRYTRMLDNLKEEFLFYRHDTTGKFTYSSPSYRNILGYTPEEYVGMKTSELWTANPLNEIADRSTRLACQGIKQPPYEMEIYHKSGAIRRFITIETPIFNDDGEVVAVEGTARDITATRRAEERLEKYRLMLEDLVEQRTRELAVSQKQLEDIFNFLPYPISVVTTDEKVVAWNRAMVELTGIEAESIIGNNYYDWLEKFYSPEAPVLIRMILEGLHGADGLEKDRVQRLAEKYRLQFDGEKILAERYLTALHGGAGGYLLTTAGPILDLDDTLLGAILFIRDITPIKEAEQQLIQSERRLSTLMGNLPGMAYRISLFGDIWQVDFVSKGCQQIFGYDPSFFFDKKLYELKELVHPDDLSRVKNEFTAAVREGKRFECEYRVVTAASETKWIVDKAEVLSRNVDGLISVEGFIADFTLFKKNEERLRNENLLLRSTIRDHNKFNQIVGGCRAMRDVYELIVRAATSEENVFIYGESGTGKELVAQAIHESSNRKGSKFVTVNCAAIPENLIESEFFGIARGAYTGAHADKQGYLEIADGGTLFLDEIGDISPNLQVKLLRAIDGGGFSPVGSRRSIYPDLRIVTASNKDLRQLMATGEMRQDFFFRIHVIPIHLPPLRERGDDLFLLINHFLKEYGVKGGYATLTQREIDTLKNYTWPGNVRELQNVLRRFLTVQNLYFLDTSDNSPRDKGRLSNMAPASHDTKLRGNIKEMEKRLILNALQKTRWNRTNAAKELGVSRKTLFRKMKAFDL